MARVLAAKANWELTNHTARWLVDHQKLKEIVHVKPVEKQKAEDVEKWLRASVPALKGPFADRPWIKHVLRELARPNYAALIC